MCQKGLWLVVRGGAGLAAWALLAPAALAQDAPDPLTDSLHVALGTFIISSQPEVRLNGDTLQGDRVDFERQLGGGDATRIRLDADWRFGDSRRHKIRAIAFAMSRERTHTIDEEITWGDDVYPIDAELKAKFEASVIELAYEYAFLKRDNYEVAASIGLHYTALDAELSAERTSTGQAIGISNDASVDAPLPVIGLRGIWRLPQNFYIDTQGQFFALSIDEYDGNLQDYRVMLSWQPRSWFGLGVGYNYFKVDVNVARNRFDGSLDWTYDGPMIFYSVSF
jgi:hypothetical protein